MSLQSNNLQTPVKDLFFNFEQWQVFRKDNVFWKKSFHTPVLATTFSEGLGAWKIPS